MKQDMVVAIHVIQIVKLLRFQLESAILQLCIYGSTLQIGIGLGLEGADIGSETTTTQIPITCSADMANKSAMVLGRRVQNQHFGGKENLLLTDAQTAAILVIL